MKTLEELDRLHAAATAGEWVHDDRDMWGCVRAPGILLTVSGAAGDGEQRATCAFIAAAKNAWPEVSARLRAAEAEVERLRGEVAEQRALLRWFLVGDDHTHEDDCGARGQHDRDVCRNEEPCADWDCEGPHCTCDATEMRDRARAALGEP